MCYYLTIIIVMSFIKKSQVISCKAKKHIICNYIISAHVVPWRMSHYDTRHAMASYLPDGIHCSLAVILSDCCTIVIYISLIHILTCIQSINVTAFYT